MAKKKVKKFWKYLGEGKLFVPGVPMRDLTVDEVDARQVSYLVQNSPLYELRPVEAQEEDQEENE